MKEIVLKCDLCGECFPLDKLKDKPIDGVRPEKIIGIKYGIHGEMVLDYKNPTACHTHICRNCLWMLRSKTE